MTGVLANITVRYRSDGFDQLRRRLLHACRSKFIALIFETVTDIYLKQVAVNKT